MLAGIVMYEVIGDKKLLDVGQSLYDYRSKISAFQQVDLSALPYELHTLLGPMLSVTPAARPSAISITGSQYFQVRSKHLCNKKGLCLSVVITTAPQTAVGNHAKKLYCSVLSGLDLSCLRTNTVIAFLCFTSQVFLLTGLQSAFFVNSQACHAVCLKIVGSLVSAVSVFVEFNDLCNIDLIAYAKTLAYVRFARLGQLQCSCLDAWVCRGM